MGGTPEKSSGKSKSVGRGRVPSVRVVDMSPEDVEMARKVINAKTSSSNPTMKISMTDRPDRPADPMSELVPDAGGSISKQMSMRTVKIERPTIEPPIEPVDPSSHPTVKMDPLKTIRMTRPKPGDPVTPETKTADPYKYVPKDSLGFISRFATKYWSMKHNRSQQKKAVLQRDGLLARREAVLRTIEKLTSEGEGPSSRTLFSEDPAARDIKVAAIEDASARAAKLDRKIMKRDLRISALDREYAEMEADVGASLAKASPAAAAKKMFKDVNEAVRDELSSEGVTVPRGVWKDCIYPFMFGTKLRGTITSAVVSAAAYAGAASLVGHKKRKDEDDAQTRALQERDRRIAEMWNTTTNDLSSVNGSTALLRYVQDVRMNGRREFAELSSSWGNDWNAYTNGCKELFSKMDSALAPFVGSDLWNTTSDSVREDMMAGSGVPQDDQARKDFSSRYDAVFRDPGSKLLGAHFYPYDLQSNYEQAVNAAGGFRGKGVDQR